MHNRPLNLVSSGLLLLGALALACSDTTSQGGGAGGSQTSNGGSAAGGKVGSGGSVSTGGSVSSGGSKGSGGAVGSGGASSSGGKVGSGGAVSSGGSDSSGGAKGTGGVTALDGGAGNGGRIGRDGGPGGESGAGGTGSGGSNAGIDAGSTPGGKSAGCGKTSSIPSSQYNNGTSISITAANMQRRFILNVPTDYDNTKPYRLVVTLHARDGNDKQMHDWQYYGLLPLGKNDSIFVAPNGQLNGKPCAGTGIGESSCGWPNTNGSDLALVDAVVAQIEENFCIDTNRIVATGWSYGGSMSYAVACERPLSNTAKANWGVRAIAIYAAAQLSGNCTPSSPVAYYHSHGTRDSVLNYDNMGMPLAQNFAKANGCTWATPTKVTSGNHVCTNMTGCKTGYPLEFCSFNGDHTPFPDNGQSQGSWGPQEAWKFLSQF